MPTPFKSIGAAAIIAGLAATAPVAQAASPGAPGASGHSCFFISEWRGWKAPSPDVLYLGVNMHDVYKVELSGGTPELMWPDVHLISRVTGSDSVCDAIDLQLSVADTGGFRVPLIARSLTKLTPEEVAAIPPKFRPN